MSSCCGVGRTGTRPIDWTALAAEAMSGPQDAPDTRRFASLFVEYRKPASLARGLGPVFASVTSLRSRLDPQGMPTNTEERSAIADGLEALTTHDAYERAFAQGWAAHCLAPHPELDTENPELDRVVDLLSAAAEYFVIGAVPVHDGHTINPLALAGRCATACIFVPRRADHAASGSSALNVEDLDRSIAGFAPVSGYPAVQTITTPTCSSQTCCGPATSAPMMTSHCAKQWTAAHHAATLLIAAERCNPAAHEMLGQIFHAGFSMVDEFDLGVVASTFAAAAPRMSAAASSGS